MAPRTVLLADDDPTVIALLGAALRKEGFRVVTAVDAMQALLMTQHRKPDVIVLDVQMPGGTGIHSLKKIKALNHTSQTPVVVISSITDPQLPDQVKELGADVFMPKPVDPAALIAELKILLEPPGKS